MAFYENYVHLCNTVNKSPSAVAVDLGLTKAAVTRWKYQGSIPRDTALLKIANYFGVSVNELLDNKDEVHYVIPAEYSLTLDKETYDVISALNRLPIKKKRFIIRNIKAILEDKDFKEW